MVDKKFAYCQSERSHFIERTATVWHVRRIAKVDYRLLGKYSSNLFKDGKTANAGVKYTNR
jgi:hypothetical protein